MLVASYAKDILTSLSVQMQVDISARPINRPILGYFEIYYAHIINYKITSKIRAHNIFSYFSE